MPDWIKIAVLIGQNIGFVRLRFYYTHFKLCCWQSFFASIIGGTCNFEKHCLFFAYLTTKFNIKYAKFMLKLLQKEFILESSRIQSERMGTVNHMKDLYDAARHLVWLTQFGLSVVLPPVLFLLGAVWLRKQFGLGGWVILVGFVLGMVAAIGSLRSSLKAIERQGRAPKKKQEPPPISFNQH